jgi:hypothetical protein
MKRITLPAVVLVACSIITIVHAEIALKSKEELQRGSTDIAIGTVKAIYAEETRDLSWHKSVGVVEIQVSTLEESKNLAIGDSVYARFWTERWIGKGNPPPYGSGHQLPKKGDVVRVYLERKDGAYEALLPNGFEAVPKSPASEAKRSSQ